MTDAATAAPAIIETEGGGREQRWPLPADEQSLLDLIHLCFDEYWDEIWFGIMVPGAAWEVAAPNPPKRISMHDGYATVDFGRWHFHLCIGEHRASGPELGQIRKCARAELYRRIGSDGFPTSWGVRLYNGRNEQMMTLMLPNPFLTNDQQIRDEPAWAQLELWDRLRATYLRLEPDPLDRSGKGFRHSLPFSGGISACGLMLASIGELVRQNISANAHIAAPRTRIYDP